MTKIVDFYTLANNYPPGTRFQRRNKPDNLMQYDEQDVWELADSGIITTYKDQLLSEGMHHVKCIDSAGITRAVYVSNNLEYEIVDE